MNLSFSQITTKLSDQLSYLKSGGLGYPNYPIKDVWYRIEFSCYALIFAIYLEPEQSVIDNNNWNVLEHFC